MKYSLYHGDHDLSKYSFLVTGGAGFIGSNIVEYLVQYGAGKIRVLDNLSTGNQENINAFIDSGKVEFIEGDIRSYDTCKQALENIDFVSHQAALGSVPRSIQDPLATNEVNISGFLNMFTAAKETGVKGMVYAASSSTYGDSPALPKKEEVIGNPLSPYAVTKYVNELYAQVFSQVYDFHTTGLRYFNVFGPRQSPNGAYAAVIPLFISQMLRGESPVINGTGETSRDFTYVSNVVQANLKSLLRTDMRSHTVLNIACGDRTDLRMLVDAINAVLKTDIRPEFRDFRKGDVLHSLADITKANTEIGYLPEISFGNGIAETISYFRDKI
jgi:UDP-N-acetylglucosamine 4-epimerase